MRDAADLKTLDGMVYIASVPRDENIISIVVKGKTLFVATDKHIYKLVKNKRLQAVNLKN